MTERRVREVRPPWHIPKIRNVGVYCRVSTGSADQLHSLASQVSHFTQLIKHKGGWRLYDFYIDVASGATNEGRPEFQRMLNDCENYRVDTVITKDVSRFGRNTEEALISLRFLTSFSVEVIFESEGINTSETSSELIISIIESVAQAENEARSANIRWGIKKGATDGTSGFFRRRCYGYRNNANGDLEIVPEEAEAVHFIFESYLKGASLNLIQGELRQRGIPSPTGKDTWCKQSINILLSNEKYTGDVLLMKSVSLGRIGSKRERNKGQAAQYLAMSCHPPIIDKETFEATQKEKVKRSNVIRIEGVVKRRDVRYSAKK
ncbi:MAG: recombinase family protein [Clostridiales bacterium]|nr:recombinase family protein [Clostridiales bacterium]